MTESGRRAATTRRCWWSGSTQRNLAESLRAMTDGRLRIEPLITHRFALERVAEAVDLLVERPAEAVGVVLQP